MLWSIKLFVSCFRQVDSMYTFNIFLAGFQRRPNSNAAHTAISHLVQGRDPVLEWGLLSWRLKWHWCICSSSLNSSALQTLRWSLFSYLVASCLSGQCFMVHLHYSRNWSGPLKNWTGSDNFYKETLNFSWGAHGFTKTWLFLSKSYQVRTNFLMGPCQFLL